MPIDDSERPQVTWFIADALTAYINRQLVIIYKSTYLKVTCDELMKYATFSPAKKSYCRIELDRDNVPTTVIKGLAWSNYQPDMQKLIVKMFERILYDSIKQDNDHTKATCYTVIE